jgi:hypothetical protein
VSGSLRKDDSLFLIAFIARSMERKIIADQRGLPQLKN